MRWRTFLSCAALAAPLITTLGCEEAKTPEARGAELFGYCEQCHGSHGEGNYEFRAPAIAGLPQWYVEAQLTKFRIGARGDNPDDVDGLRMRPMSRTLATTREVQLVAAYVSSLPRVDPEAQLEAGDPDRGRQLFTPCVQCHQQDAMGSQEKNAPPLAVHSDWYIVAQLTKFKAGVRGADPLDATGSQMRAMAVTVPDEQAMRDLAAYITSLRPAHD